jgi:hypothetical protein
MSNFKNTRREARAQRLVHAHWLYRESEGASAEVLDASSGGLFIVPCGEIPDSIGQGDRVWIVVSHLDGSATLTGTVRWRGYSQAHDAIGFGIELDTNCRELAAQVLAAQ